MNQPKDKNEEEKQEIPVPKNEEPPVPIEEPKKEIPIEDPTPKKPEQIV